MTEFPYPCLLTGLPGCLVAESNNYYRIKPHKAVHLLVKMKQNKTGMPGIYIFGENKIIGTLRKKLSCCQEIYNLQNEKELLLFVDENSPAFYKDIEQLIQWIKAIK